MLYIIYLCIIVNLDVVRVDCVSLTFLILCNHVQSSVVDVCELGVNYSL